MTERDGKEIPRIHEVFSSLGRRDITNGSRVWVCVGGTTLVSTLRGS